LLAAYQEVVREYREAEIGIYDDSADVHRAMGVSAAYFGDAGSSLAAMYMVSGRPVVEQIVQWRVNYTEPALMVTGIALDENGGLWGSARKYNGVFRLNFEMGEIEAFYKTPGEFLFEWVTTPAIADRRLYWASYAGNSVVAIDLDTGAPTIKRLDSETRGGNHGLPLSIASVGSQMMVVPQQDQGIFLYNPEKRLWKKDARWIASMTRICGKEPGRYFGTGICFHSGRVYLPVFECNAVMEYDPTNGETRFHTVGSPENRYGIVLFWDGAFWITPVNPNGPVVQWEPDTGRTIEYRDYPIGYSAGEVPFSGICEYQGDLLLFPCVSNMLIRLNPKTGVMTKWTDLPVSDTCATRLQYTFAKRIGDWIYAVADFSQTVYSLHTKTGDVQKQRFLLTRETWRKVLNTVEKEVSLSNERPVEQYLIREQSLQGSAVRFFDALLGGDHPLDLGAKNAIQSVAANLDGTAGEKICAYIMKSFG
jgi:outer membrane protein assembly factor BamB